MLKNFLNLKNSHLLISTLIVIPVAFLYGFYPDYLFNIQINSIDEANVLKAIMGLYLAFASLLVLGIFNLKYWKATTISNILFMLGIAFGRIVSIIVDGLPSMIFVLGTLGELV